MNKKLMIGLAFIAAGITSANAQEKMKPEETEFYSPVPPVVTPGKTCGDAPSDAIILFDGKDLSKWVTTNDTTKAAESDVHDGVMTVNKKGGNIQTKQSFLNYQLHIEWKEPVNIDGSGQGR